MAIDNDMKRLADLNGLTEDLYSDEVRSGAKEEYPFIEDEVAILRKEVAHLSGVLSKLTGKDVNSAEFKEYNERIESIKAKTKGDLRLD